MIEKDFESQEADKKEKNKTDYIMTEKRKEK